LSCPADTPVIILCGGMGTRLREATERLPKPMVDIGGRPILWHIMKLYSHHGFRRFVLALGYKSDEIKRYFLDYRTQTSDFTLHMGDGHRREFHTSHAEQDWQITFAETGLTTGTGARVRRVLPYLGDAGTVMVTYGDGLGDVDLTALLEGHHRAGLPATVTGVHPSSRYGELSLREDGDDDRVQSFDEKPTTTEGWVSGGFFVFSRQVLEGLAEDPQLFLEREPLRRLAAEGGLRLHRHDGFWMGMDTFRDWTELNAMWDERRAPWRVWPDGTAG
jgi:glucose-1-phosphate cytidylyltransferase